MKRPDPSLWLPAYGLFLVLGAVIALAANLAEPSENALLFGYSLERLLLGSGLLVLAGALLFLTWKLFCQRDLSLRLWVSLTARGRTSDMVFFSALTIFLLLVLLLLVPDYRLGRFASYAARLYPILVWLAASSGVAALVVLAGRSRITLRQIIQADAKILTVGLVIFGAAIALWGLIAVTGLGIRDAEEYWYSAGVPVLGLQVLASLVAGALFLRSKPTWDRKYEILFCVLIWALSAWMWVREPLSTNYFFPDNANNVIYPYSDSATFDVGSQFALIGQGLFNGAYFDRALYSAFLTYLHVLFGEDAHLLMNVQAAIFAVFPMIVYLIGRELHSRALGVSAALLLALRGVNSIYAAKWIDTASPKMMLTDFPAAIGVALFILLALKWLKDPSRTILAVWAGGALGLTVMLRTNAFMLLPVVLVLAFIFIKPRWNRAAVGSVLMILGMLTATLPWDIRNRDNGIPFFYVYYSRIELILRYRYGIGAEMYTPPQEQVALPLRARMMPQDLPDEVCSSTPCSIVHHLLHNGVTSVISLPHSLVIDDLWNTIKFGDPFWRNDWDGGGLSTRTVGFLVLNLFVLSLGIGSLWERSKAGAALVVLLFWAYHLTNSLGFTSGGRYIVPIDWLISVFLMAGLLQFMIWFLRLADVLPASDSPMPAQPRGVSPRWMPILTNLLLVFMVGSLVPLAETPFERRYQSRTSAEALESLEKSGVLAQSEFSKAELSAFLNDGGARLMEGRILYPRYYPAGGGQADLSTYYMEREYPRLVFTLIGPYARLAEGIILPGDRPNVPLHLQDVVVIGCWNNQHYAGFIDALMIIVLGEEPYIHYRYPGVPLQCPFDEP